MGQTDIYEYLKKHKGKWFTSGEIASALGVGTSSISTSLKRLRKYKRIMFKENPEKKGTYLYMVK